MSWLCRPGQMAQPCTGDLATTVQSLNGAARVDTPIVDRDPPIDCFYVYPTVSQQPGYNATKDADAQVRAIALYQAQRFSSVCRVYAPLYRQETLTGLALDGITGQSHYRVPYADVAEAFATYLREDNDGRGFVLIGHSQGTALLRALVRREIDGVPSLRRRLVSAVLLGGNVTVRRGQAAGGDFQNIPGCSSPGEVGCVIAWSTFGETPPAGAGFGRVPTVDQDGLGAPTGSQYQVLCTDPIALRGAPPGTPLTTLLPSQPFPGAIGGFLIQMFGGPPPTAPTPWLQPADRYIARCEDDGGAVVLRISPVGASRRLNPAPTREFGLHLADGNLALGDLVSIVGAQSTAYRLATAVTSVRLSARPLRTGRTQLTVRVAHAPAAPGLRVLLRRAGKIVAIRTAVPTTGATTLVRFVVRRAGSYQASARATGARVSSSVASGMVKVGTSSR
ncbi:MAG: hypothetical protein JWO02_1349 [Solirubrobacterales bacterium]|nr:hypothetical protein [Solirubrobacterales bacterium]